MWMLPRKKLGGSPPFERMYVEENSFFWLQGEKKTLKQKPCSTSFFFGSENLKHQQMYGCA